jgi:hypothetical protein
MPVITRYPTSNTVVTTGWTNPTNAYVAEGSPAYATAAPSKSTQITSSFGGFDFASVLGAGDTINSVTLEIRYKYSTAASTNYTLSMRPYVGSTILGTTWSTTLSPTTDTSGTSSQTLVTRTDLRDATFNVRVGCARNTTNTNSTCSMDYVRVVVDYTAGVAPTAVANLAGGAGESGQVPANYVF